MKKFILVLITHFFILSGICQTLSTTQDTSHKTSVSYLKFIQEESEKSKEQFSNDKISLNQELLLEKILQSARIAKEYLKSGIDTAALQNHLADIHEKYVIASDGVFTNAGAIQTHRNLTMTAKILKELLSELNTRKTKIDLHKSKLIHYRNTIDSLCSDPALFVTVEDSAVLADHLQKLAIISREVYPVDSMLKQSIRSLKKIKEHIDYTVFEIVTALDRVEQSEIELSGKLFDQELGYLWQTDVDDRFNEILYQSLKKCGLTLKYYLRNNTGKILLLVTLVILSFLFVTALKKKAQKEHLIRSDFSDQLVIKYPLLTAIMLTFNIFQFIFPDPPFIFSCLLWLVSTTCLTCIFINHISRYWMYFWLLMWLLFILVCANNLIVQASGVERWIMLSIALIGLLASSFILSKKRRDELREKLIVYIIVFVVIIEAASILANVYGRFNVSKSLLTSGFINLIIAISFLWTIRLINEGLLLASKMFQTPERRLFYINFDVIGNKAPMFLYIFLVIGWFTVFARNFYEFHFITQPVTDLIYSEITIGDYIFSIYNVVLFFVILFFATVLSRIISFFEGDAYSPSVNNKKPTLGSWILLIRIFIIVKGFLIAFAAAGIPLDKATFVLGALGVGIGFGLQSLVQNLVSGIILTFEKPVNVGDYVEIKGQKGTIKSIGFRSSVLLTIEGSKMIIPNGDILNDNVVNWTHERGMNRRTEIGIKVAYGTDLELARKILIDLARDQDSILNSPTPYVLISDVDSGSIKLQLFFWTSTPFSGSFVKSELIIAIQREFTASNISFPQQDIYINTIASNETKK